jgi:hypothetical protein
MRDDGQRAVCKPLMRIHQQLADNAVQTKWKAASALFLRRRR